MKRTTNLIINTSVNDPVNKPEPESKPKNISTAISKTFREKNFGSNKILSEQQSSFSKDEKELSV